MRRVLAKALASTIGNPHATHDHGTACAKAVEAARLQVGALLGAEPADVVFTSGATEANNLAILGLRSWMDEHRKRHIVVSPIEHKSVLEPIARLRDLGYDVSTVPVGRDGIVAPASVEAALREDTGLVAVMAANNEVGTLQPIADIARTCSARDVFFHTDATQFVGKVDEPIVCPGVTSAAVSSHKLYGPGGVGALYATRRFRKCLTALVTGGGQEQNLRAGTVPTPLCIAFGAASRIARESVSDEAKRLRLLRDRLAAALQKGAPGARLNGHRKKRLPGNLNMSFPDVDAEGLTMHVRRDISISTGSACTSTSISSSHVLDAMGLSTDVAESSVRIGIGRFTTSADVDFAARVIVGAVKQLRSIRVLH